MGPKHLNRFCDCCEEAFSFNPGIKGKRANLKKILFVLHRSDSREPQPSHPATYKAALLDSQTGKILTEMLEFCHLTIEDVYLTNVFKCLLPRDREPNINEYQACIQVLKRQINNFNPGKIVIFGHKTYEHIFQKIAKQNNYQDMIMQTLDFNGIPALISYHPGWIWKFKTEKRKKHYTGIKKFLNG